MVAYPGASGSFPFAISPTPKRLERRPQIFVMRPYDPFLRGRHYFQKHGFGRTARRLYEQLYRRAFANREIVYWMDLSSAPVLTHSDCAPHVILSISDPAHLPEDLQARLAEQYPAHIVSRTIAARFEEGATLWCLLERTEPLGYTWTITGRTLKPYYFPLTAVDVHVFDDFVFPAYRGRRLNAILLTHMLATLKQAGLQRAYIETAEWNTAEQRSLEGIGFHRLGYADKRRRDGKTIHPESATV